MLSGEKVLTESVQRILAGMSQEDMDYLRKIVDTLDFTKKPEKTG